MRMILGTIAVIAALALAPAAFAQSSSVDGYGGDGGQAVGLTGVNDDPSGSGDGAVSNSGALPFTGLDVSLLAGGGLVLLLAGVGMARLVARDQDPA